MRMITMKTLRMAARWATRVLDVRVPMDKANGLRTH
jgi:hypothetical protein